jgi:hypothetical protein
MAHEVDLAAAILIPQVHGEDKESAVDVLEVDLFSSGRVAHNQPNARRRSNGASVLSLAACLSLAPY